MRQINRSRSKSHSGGQGKRLKTEFELVWWGGGGKNSDAGSLSLFASSGSWKAKARPSVSHLSELMKGNDSR